MANHILNRDIIITRLKEELVGPSPQGQRIDCSKEIVFQTQEESYGPWQQLDTGEEILLRDPPTRRYGIGVLFPLGTAILDTPGPISDPMDLVDEATDEPVISEWAVEQAEAILARTGLDRTTADIDDYELIAANAYKPSSMAVSFLAELPDHAVLVVDVRGGRYQRKIVKVAGQERIWWLRIPVAMRAELEGEQLIAQKRGSVTATIVQSSNLEGMDLRVQVFSRPQPNSRQSLITVCLVNRTPKSGDLDSRCLFQSFFKVSVQTPLTHNAYILPYPRPPYEQLDEEEESLELLYRNHPIYAVGHGCAANWGNGSGPEGLCEINFARVTADRPRETVQKVNWVSAECLPVIEVPSVTPYITRPDGSEIQVSMASLAGLSPNDDAMSSLVEVINLYDAWIQQKTNELSTLEEQFRPAAVRNLAECRRCVQRMRAGLAYLQANPLALKAFQLANHAILLQQVRYRRESRQVSYDTRTQRLIFAPAMQPVEPLIVPKDRGTWRAFQIAFLLMALPSCADKSAPDRDIVELIWFPTGGGKTEAYLGLAAFSMFYARLADPSDAGVHVLMRYTLRLLTTQQFQRAAGLICAMEYLRKRNKELLGDREFSIGIWLGGETTPNTRDKAIEALNRLQRDSRNNENPFILGRCPWCGAQMGRIKYEKSTPKSAPRVAGYRREGNTVVFFCPDRECAFAHQLPIYVIDEDIYDKRPSLVIGTVDKFALLAWQPRARALFGLDDEGARICSPPNLIIQDELHLISGPLGSMVGLYELLINELCSYCQDGRLIQPKIVSSTATIRRYGEQIRALYARADTALFPPPGLDIGDSFFAQYDRELDGTLRRGRIYIGVHAPALGSIQTAQVRTISALLQAPVPLSPEERDPWWTLLLFFNSLRELGTTVSLLQSDIPDYLRVIQNRLGLEPNEMRRLGNILELTGRLRSDEVPDALDALEVTTKSQDKWPVDVCLASSIIEVGVDIDRLSLMAITGQPKTTAQYIQVTGRIGRRTRERPGLVVVIYGASKPRDRSHFEKFRSYHERLYAQVEPTSVTPFSLPALDRALHAVMVAYVRQLGNAAQATSPYPYPSSLIEQLWERVLDRVKLVDTEEATNVERIFAKRADEWRRWERLKWEARPQDYDIPLLRPAGAYVSRERERISWPVPLSMRNVDAECEGTITQLYLNAPEEGARA